MPNYIAELRPHLSNIGSAVWQQQVGRVYVLPIAPPENALRRRSWSASFIPDDTDLTYMSRAVYERFEVGSKQVLQIFIRDVATHLETDLRIPTETIIPSSKLTRYHFKISGKLMLRRFTMDWSSWPLELQLAAKSGNCRPWGPAVTQSTGGS